jgi:hypothetical protein
MSPSPSTPSKATGTTRARAADATADTSRVARLCALAILVPGLGHALIGQMRKAAIFFVVLMTMFAVGLAFGGRLLPFALDEPLVFLGAGAQWVLLLPRILAGLAGLGAGDVVSVTYEYGNTFLIVAGLLNALITLDVYDLATGRKPS